MLSKLTALQSRGAYCLPEEMEVEAATDSFSLKGPERKESTERRGWRSDLSSELLADLVPVSCETCAAVAMIAYACLPHPSNRTPLLPPRHPPPTA